VVASASLALLLGLAACGGGPGGGGDASRAASGFSREGTAAARHFLDTYVADDGRVQRHDQGDDVVSEGQAYGMLVAELVGEDDTVRSIWTWTRQHLQRPDGLLSFHADASGKVVDAQSATDADTLAAYALLRYDGPDAGALHADGTRLARAVLDHETVTDGQGGLVPVAGSWVQAGGSVAVNPSYWMPGVATELAKLTHDDRWSTVASTTVRLAGQLTADGSRLPPDWARLQGGQVEPTGAPDGSRPPQYGPDAQRALPFFAAGCSADAVKLASAWWRLLAPDDRSSALALGLDGSVADGSRSPLALVAAAAGARAAGDDSRGAQLVGAATDQTRSAPTYYGDAWLALAAGLAERRLVTC
jgi:endoglucanase